MKEDEKLLRMIVLNAIRKKADDIAKCSKAEGTTCNVYLTSVSWEIAEFSEIEKTFEELCEHISTDEEVLNLLNSVSEKRIKNPTLMPLVEEDGADIDLLFTLK